MAEFTQKNWLNTGDEGANVSNSVLNKDTLNDLEKRISDGFNNLLKIESGTLTKVSEDITLDANQIFKIGNVVFMQVYFRVNSEIPANTQIVKIPNSFKTSRIMCFVGTTNSDVVHTFYLSNSSLTINNRVSIQPSTCRIDYVYIIN